MGVYSSVIPLRIGFVFVVHMTQVWFSVKQGIFGHHGHVLSYNAVIKCIPGPHYPGNSRGLAGTYLGIYRILCPRRPGTYPGLMRGDISVKRAGNLLPRDVETLTKGARGYGAGTYPGDLQEKCPPQS